VLKPQDEAAPGGDLLFIVPCRNEAAHIGEVIATLLEDDAAAAALIVVVDGESEDESPQIVRRIQKDHPRVHLLANPARLQSAGVNLAVDRFGEGRSFLVRVDAHAAYPPHYGSNLRRIAVETGADSVVVAMKAVGRTCFQRAAAAAQNSRLSNGGAAHRQGREDGWVDHGHHALMRIAAFKAVGGYNARFSTNEDAELDQRLNAAGYRVWMAGSGTIRYYPRSAPLALWRQYMRHGAGRAATMRLHRLRPRIRQWIPILLLPGIAPLLAAPWFPLFALPFLIWASACTAYGVAIAVREKERCALLSGPAAMIMHLGWSIGFWRHWLTAATHRAPRGEVL